MESKVEEPPHQEQQEAIAITAPIIEKPMEPTEPVEPKGDQPDSDDEIDSKLYTVPGTGRTVTLQMLLSANVLTPGKSLMSIEYLGQKFVGDLLPDGKIKSQETETIFCSPSAWAIHCKRIINPDKKSGCGWASVKYKGKKLDVYKATWMRKCQIQRDQRDQSPTDEEEEEKNMEPPPPPPKRFVVPHNTIINRHIPHDSNTLIEAVEFATLGKIQPFLVTITTSAALMIDFHCHLTKNEVCGYLGGTWDVNSHTLFITHTFPCRNSRFDRDTAAECEYNIQKAMIQQNVNLVGWYHSHPVFSANPTLRDCDTQLDYQIKMRGLTEASYTPCVGIICSPYDIENSTSESKFLAYWVHPPAENKPAEYGRPMLMNFAIQQDDTLQDGLQDEMKLCVDYYKQFKNELISFERNFLNETSFISKMKTSLFSKFPRNQSDGAFWNWIRQLLGLAMEEVVELPKIMKQAQQQQQQQQQQQPLAVQQESASKVAAVKDDEPPSETESETTQNLHAIQALQQQLAQPSGLNMTPSPLATALHLPVAVTSASSNANNVGNSTSNTNTTSSPRDSPVTIPSNSVSPAKFEIPIRASPSPAKSDASSCRTRNSPAPSPGKLNILGDPIARSSPSAKSDFGADLYAATLASLAGKSQSELNANDLSALLQYTKKSDLYGLAALNALQSGGITGAAAPPGSKGGNSGLPPIPNIKEFMAQLEKGNLSLLMQSQYPMASVQSMSHHSTSGTSKSSESKSSNKHDKSSSSSHYSKQQQQQQQQLHDLYNYSSSASKSGSSGRSAQSQAQPHLIELDDFKSDRQLAELMKSPEYTQMLLQQAQALSGLGSEISVTKKPTKKASAAAAAAAASTPYSLPPLPTAADLNQLLEASQRIPELNNLLQSANPNDINALLSLQSAQMLTKSQLDYASLFGAPMGGMSSGGGGSSKSSSKQQQQQQQQAANAAAAAAQQYMSMTQQDLSALFGITPPTPSSSSSSKKSSASSSLSAAEKNQMHAMSNPAEMLNSLFTAAAGKMGDMSSFMGNWGVPSPSSAQSSAYSKSLSDLNAMFGGSATTASTSGGSGAGGSSKSSNPFDPAMMFPHVSPSKMQELFQQGKYPSIIPDPLASSTLAANNLYLSPSLLKLQQEAAKGSTSPLMKPPKSSSSSSTTSSLGKIETPPPPLSSSPAISEKLHRSTPTKSCESPAPPIKYNFSAADLAVSSVSPAISASSDYSGKLSHTPPIGAMDAMLNLSASAVPTPPIKKRMEFSSIADLAAPPPHKMAKMDEEGDDGSGSAVLNLSNN